MYSYESASPSTSNKLSLDDESSGDNEGNDTSKNGLVKDGSSVGWLERESNDWNCDSFNKEPSESTSCVWDDKWWKELLQLFGDEVDK